MDPERPRKRLRIQVPNNSNSDISQTNHDYHEDGQPLPSPDTASVQGIQPHAQYQSNEDACTETTRAQRRHGMVFPTSVNTDHILLDNHILNNGISRLPQPSFAPSNQEFVYQNRPAPSQANIPSDNWRRIAKRAFAPTNNGQASGDTTVQQYLSRQHQSEQRAVGTKEAASQTTQPESTDPLGHLKLAAEAPTEEHPPRLDQVSQITKVADFLKPQIPIPEHDAPIYRNNFHKQHIPESTFTRTMPDQAESQAFVDDLLVGKTVKLTEHGDVPALNTQVKRDRVPVRARNAPVNGPPTLYRKPTGFMPYHALAAAKVSQARRGHKGSTAQSANHERKDLKRKRPAFTLPLQPLQSRPRPVNFNIFQDGFLNHQDLCLHLAANMTVQTLIGLYSISKDFHTIVNSRFTTVILNQTSLKAPAAARAYHWRCFDSLSQPDPSHNLNNLIINKPAPPNPPRPKITEHGYTFTQAKKPPRHRARFPTFRWLQLAIHREKVIHALYHAFAARGIPLPGSPDDVSTNSFALSLHKLWFIFDIPDNHRRVYFIRQPALITDSDLSNILTFIVKLDMACHDPVGPEKRDGMRRLMMSSCHGLADMLRCIRGEIWETELDVLRAWTRYGLQLDREDAEPGVWRPLGLSREEIEGCKTVFGIPRAEVGMLKKEFWGKMDFDANGERKALKGLGTVKGLGRQPAYLLRPDQIVIREVVNRGMKFGKNFLRALIDGYVDYETMEALPPRDLNGGRSRNLEKEDEYDVDDAVAGIQALAVEEGGDELLDLGDTWKGSPWTVARQAVSLKEINRRIEEQQRYEEIKTVWRSEVDEEKRRTKNARYKIVIDPTC